MTPGSRDLVVFIQRQMDSREGKVCRNFAAKRRKTILINGVNQGLAWPKCFGISGPF
jgi:hypothetical protein